LATGSLFSSGKRTVIVEEADEFVKRYRGELESIAERIPQLTNVLVLVVGTWQSNTRLYKSLDQNGLQIDCNLPTITSGKSKSIDEGRIMEWLVQRAQSVYGLTLAKGAARQLMQLNEIHLGLYDQQLAKLSCCVPPSATAKPEDVQQFIGGWRDTTVWKMADAALDGDAQVALQLLHQLIHGGEDPFAIFAQLAWACGMQTLSLRAIG
jgi:DNA polymerase-3 subunit delta